MANQFSKQLFYIIRFQHTCHQNRLSLNKHIKEDIHHLAKQFTEKYNKVSAHSKDRKEENLLTNRQARQDGRNKNKQSL